MKKEISYYFEDLSRLTEFSIQDLEDRIKLEPFNQALQLLAHEKRQSINNRSTYAAHYVQDMEHPTDTYSAYSTLAHPLANDTSEDGILEEVLETQDKIVAVNEVSHDSADDLKEEEIINEVLEDSNSEVDEETKASNIEQATEGIGAALSNTSNNEEPSDSEEFREAMDVLKDDISLQSIDSSEEATDILRGELESVEAKSQILESEVEQILQKPEKIDKDDEIELLLEPIDVNENAKEIDKDILGMLEPDEEMQSLESMVIDLEKAKKKKKKKSKKVKAKGKKSSKNKQSLILPEIDQNSSDAENDLEGESSYTQWLMAQKPVNGDKRSKKKKKVKNDSDKLKETTSKKSKLKKKTKKKDSKKSKKKSVELKNQKSKIKESKIKASKGRKAQDQKKNKNQKAKKSKTADKVNSSVKESEIILSEPLAEILAAQGHRKKAKLMYQRLSLIFPEKSAYFAAKIKNLKKGK